MERNKGTARQNVRVMLAGTLLLGMGEELWSRFLPNEIDALGGGVWAIALYGTLRDFLDAVYQYPGGWIADRLGRKKSLSLFICIAVLGYCIYFVGLGWAWILVGTLFVMAWSSLALPGLFAVIGDNLPESRRAAGFGMQASLKRIPIVVAPPIGGWLIASRGMAGGLKTGFGITIMLALSAALGLLLLYREERVPVRVEGGGQKRCGVVSISA